jgi:hypothetical protein
MAEDSDIEDCDAAHWHKIARDCFVHDLYPSEPEFLERMVALTFADGIPSLAQQSWLRKILRRARRR